MKDFSEQSKEIDSKLKYLQKISQLPEEYQREYLVSFQHPFVKAMFLLNGAINTIFLAVLVVICILSIFVLSNRIELDLMVNQQIAENNETIADRLQGEQIGQPEIGDTQAESEAFTTQKNKDQELLRDFATQNGKNELYTWKKYNLERIQQSISSITSTGDSFQLSIECLRQASLYINEFSARSFGNYDALSCLTIKKYVNDFDESLILRPPDTLFKSTNLPTFILYGFNSMSNLLLLAMGMISAAGIGAVSAELRKRKTADISKLAVGLASGFITFLAVKGGRFLLLAPNQFVDVDLNPYGMLLLGVLVGLFSDKAYALISGIVDDLSSRLGAGPAAETENGKPSSKTS